MNDQDASNGQTAPNEPSSAPAVPRALARELGEVAENSALTGKRPAAAGKKIAVHEGSPQGESVPLKPKASATKPELLRLPATTDQAESEQPVVEDSYDDLKTDAAVDDIVRRESDVLLDVQSAANAGEHVPPPHFKHHWFKRWLHSSLARWATFLLLLMVCGVVFGVASARYWVLNHVGVRASLSVTITDGGTLLPLAGATVSADGQQAATNQNGVATLRHLRLGAQQLRLSRVAFAAQTHSVVVGWGENPLGSFALKPTGVRYTVKAVDYFSGQPLPTATATSDTLEAASDKTGLITLTLQTDASAMASASVAAAGYRNENVTLKPTGVNTVALVPSAKDVFVAKQSGTYNVYAVDADGANQKELLAGVGSETPGAMALAPSPDNARAALVSVRDHTVDAAGVHEQALTLINTSNGAATVLDHADSIKLLGWSGPALVYETAANSNGAVSASRVQIISYNYATATRRRLAAANDFNGVVYAQNAVYYAISSSDPNATADFYKVNVDGTGGQTILTQEVIGVYRSLFGTLTLQTAGAWYAYGIGVSGNVQPQAIAQPASYPNTLFAASPDGVRAAAIVTSGGKTSLQIVTTANGQTATLTLAQTPAYPLYWLNNATLVFRSNGADYAVSVAGGSAKKITNAANVSAY